MTGPAAVLASLLLAASAPVGALRDVSWIVGPASVELGGGRVRCALPDGVALARGAEAHAILDVVIGGARGAELAVVSPTAPSRRWFVVLGWEAGAKGAARRWTEAGAAEDGGRVVNEHVRIPAAGGALKVTLVAPATEHAEAKAHLDRIVEGLRVAPPARAER